MRTRRCRGRAARRRRVQSSPLRPPAPRPLAGPAAPADRTDSLSHDTRPPAHRGRPGSVQSTRPLRSLGSPLSAGRGESGQRETRARAGCPGVGAQPEVDAALGGLGREPAGSCRRRRWPDSSSRPRSRTATAARRQLGQPVAQRRAGTAPHGGQVQLAGDRQPQRRPRPRARAPRGPGLAPLRGRRRAPAAARRRAVGVGPHRRGVAGAPSRGRRRNRRPCRRRPRARGRPRRPPRGR